MDEGAGLSAETAVQPFQFQDLSNENQELIYQDFANSPSHARSERRTNLTLMSVNYMQQLPGGLCFAHGPYSEGFNCPQWPACVTDSQQPEFVAAGEAQTQLKSLESAVVVAAIKCWYTDGSDDTGNGSADLKHAVDDLLNARVKARVGEVQV